MTRSLLPGAPVAPFDALFDLDGVRPNRSSEEDVWGTLRDAEVITAVDHMTGREVVVFGRELLRRLVETGGRRWADVLRVGLDFDAGELPRLRAAVAAVKGG
jgi:hypothetical protein